MSNRIEDLVRASLSETRQSSFQSGFADRTIERWRNQKKEIDFGDVIARKLIRLTPVAIAAGLLLAFYNVRQPVQSPALDRLLGLTTVTVDVAYDFGGGNAN